MVKGYLDRCRDKPFSYSAVGTTATESSCQTPPAGFRLDQYEVVLGSGQEVYERARQAIQQWQMFPQSMVELFWPTAPIEEGTAVAVLFRGYGFWSLNPARIVYVLDESGESDRFGFAYGTLPGHLERGEELFCVDWDHKTDRVRYQITAFSRPDHWFVWLGYPLARREQARFRLLSGQSMQAAVKSPTPSSLFER